METERPYAAIPVRCLSDSALNDKDRRVLGSIAYFANRAGVCWPSLKSINSKCRIDRHEIQACIRKLTNLGYIRLLKPNDAFQKKGPSGFHSNRFQVLWNENDPLPDLEEIKTAIYFQAACDITYEEMGLLRGENRNVHTDARALANRFWIEINRRWGMALADKELIVNSAYKVLESIDLDAAFVILETDLDRRITYGQSPPISLTAICWNAPPEAPVTIIDEFKSLRFQNPIDRRPRYP